jgi:phosphatidylglycerophosphate synthase
MPPGDDERGAAPTKKDFAALRQSDDAVGASRAIGGGFGAARDAVARFLLGFGVTPNILTITGFAFTCAAGYCLLRGAGQQVPYFALAGGPVGWWPLATALFLILAGACDMLDGAVARIGGLGSQSGALLDSSIDRFSDIAIYAGCFLYFATLERPNLTYQVLAVVAMCNAVLISYIKARAEDLIADCTVGYWLRGERFAGFLIACLVGHIPATLWQMSISCGFTVWRRLTYGFAAVRAQETGQPAPARGPSARWWGVFQLWRHPRGSVHYDVVTGTHIAYIIAGPLIWPALLWVGPEADPLRDLLALIAPSG